MSGTRWMGFGIVWVALAVLSFDSLRNLPRRGRPDVEAVLP
jgi:chloramphenicol-sensitive protein RarD